MHPHLRLGALKVLAACLLFSGLPGCNSQSTDLQPETPSLSIQLNWIPDAQHGGFYVAVHEEHFAKAGLAVQLIPGGPGTPALSKLALGRCDFAVGNADQVLLAQQQGADVVAVFAAMQNSPRCIMVHEASGIESLDELKDITLALGDGKAFAEYLKSKVPLDNVRIVSYSGTVAKFLLDENFAQQGYSFSEPILAASQGGDPKTLMVSELGFNPYSSLLITRRELIESNPEMVKKVVEAVRLGWQGYLKDPSQANAEILKANPEMESDILAASAKAIQPLCSPAPDSVLGSMTPDRWETLRSQLIELKLLPADARPASDAYVVLP